MHDMMSQETENYGHSATMKRGQSTVGQRIVRARQAAGLGQAEMARLLGASTATVFRWEHDKVDVPIERLRAVAELCGVPVADLIPDANDTPEAAPVSYGPEAYGPFAQLGMAAALGDEKAKSKLDELIRERARALEAAARRRSG